MLLKSNANFRHPYHLALFSPFLIRITHFLPLLSVMLPKLYRVELLTCYRDFSESLRVFQVPVRIGHDDCFKLSRYPPLSVLGDSIDVSS